MRPQKKVWILVYSRRLAMAFKASIAGLLTALLVLYTWNDKHAPVFFIFFPIVATIVDIVLYRRRNTIFKNFEDIKDADIPKKYKIKATDLLFFAKNFPKLHFMRFIPGILAFPFFSIKYPHFSLDTAFMSSLIVIYFIAIIFDSLWARYVFKIKEPTFKPILGSPGTSTIPHSTGQTMSSDTTHYHNYHRHHLRN